MGPFAMRIIFALMDRDGDGTVSLEEFQAAHASIFKAMDADKDGTVSMEEMRDFFHGGQKAGLPNGQRRETRTTGLRPEFCRRGIGGPSKSNCRTGPHSAYGGLW